MRGTPERENRAGGERHQDQSSSGAVKLEYHADFRRDTLVWTVAVPFSPFFEGRWERGRSGAVIGYFGRFHEHGYS
jgi:hypothetical protein